MKEPKFNRSAVAQVDSKSQVQPAIWRYQTVGYRRASTEYSQAHEPVLVLGVQSSPLEFHGPSGELRDSSVSMDPALIKIQSYPSPDDKTLS